MNGRVRSTSIAANMATTPPSLFGIERRMAYAQRKYHSGLICTGVTNGFAGMKFSGSPNMFGQNRTIVARVRSIIANPRVSFLV